MTRGRPHPARVVAAALTVLGGSVHLQQWWTIFRHLDIGPLFVLNAAASVVVATCLIGRDDQWPVVAGLLLAVGSLGALFASRTSGLLGFEATGYDTAEIEAIVIEVAAALTLTAILVHPARPSRARGSTAGASEVLHPG